MLPSGQTTQDAASLTVEFTPTNPQLAINYVFASEEYEECVDTQFNDVFAFFVNGVNCALTPGTNNPITVNTINPGSNALFYVPNDDGTYDTEFDGFTVVLTCRAAVNPGVTEHVAPGHCRRQRRHPRLRCVPPGERCLVEPDRAVAADHAEPAARHP